MAEIEEENARAVSFFNSLTIPQRHFLHMLVLLGVEGDAKVGTFLLMKDNQEEMEDFFLWMYDNRPNPDQICKHLCEVVSSRNQKEEKNGNTNREQD